MAADQWRRAREKISAIFLKFSRMVREWWQIFISILTPRVSLISLFSTFNLTSILFSESKLLNRKCDTRYALPPRFQFLLFRYAEKSVISARSRLIDQSDLPNFELRYRYLMPLQMAFTSERSFSWNLHLRHVSLKGFQLRTVFIAVTQGAGGTDVTPTRIFKAINLI